ncbi:c-type cytochrome [Bradyrhizobium liaoningense]|uniref:c-type cytochrome n=1 Tax=Bradyrhizobium liaoningense TaxID=43992 RepID=UPI001BA657A9|nr:c-type cytochrome [Bradyrhizobium liaoningense]MBR0719504.1 cytochrome c [Bradyrhizobium liaoningense]
MSRRIRRSVGLTILVLSLVGIVHTVTAAPRSAARAAEDGHRLAQAWCQTCHAIEPHMTGLFDAAPSFQAIADRKGTTALSLKVFWRTSHQNMPNLVIAPDQADALAAYILSLKGD